MDHEHPHGKRQRIDAGRGEDDNHAHSDYFDGEDEEHGDGFHDGFRGRQNARWARPKFSSRLENAKELQTLLNCLTNGTKKDQICQISVHPDRMEFTVASTSRSLQVVGTLKRVNFSAYDVADEGNPVTFWVNVNNVLECLGLLGPSSAQNGPSTPSVNLSYSDDTCIFRLELNDDAVTYCDISTLDVPDKTDESDMWARKAEAFRSHLQRCQIVMKSEHLRETLQELRDLSGASAVHILMSPNAPHFQLAAHGNLGKLEIEFPKNSELFVIFECPIKIEFAFQLDSIIQAMRALTVAEETFFRISNKGMLCIQHKLESQSGGDMSVDFMLTANCADDEEEKDGDGE